MFPEDFLFTLLSKKYVTIDYMKKRSLFRYFKKWYVIIGVIIILIILGYWLAHRTSTPTFEYTTASIGIVREQVSVTGAVSPVSKASLSFEKSGVISKVFLKVGDIVKAGDPIASLDNTSDLAAVSSAEATLADLSRSLRPEEYVADQSVVNSASTSLTNALQSAVNAIHNGYVQAEGAVVNYGDTFFTNPQSANPIINIRVDSSSISLAINNERVVVDTVLSQWQNDSNSATTANVTTLITNAEGYSTTIKGFLNDLADLVNNLNPGNSGLPQSSINTAVATINTALSNLNQAITTISSADTALKAATSAYSQAQSTFTLQQAGASPDAIAAQAAKVAQAKAVLAEDTLVSPIDGIVTQEDPNLGEYTGPGQSGFAVQNKGFKIEAYVPEADIAKVEVGNLASSTLDAYGSFADFPAKVVMIDPAETVLQGVPTYKVTLQFITPDARIRSGMTSNLEILTHESDSVLEIPYRAVIITATSSMVRVVSTDGKSYSSVPIVTGLKGSDGSIQVISGLKVGDKVVTYAK